MDAKRIVTSAFAARRAHERALHDGVQQDLISTSVRLQLARKLVDSDPAAASVLLDELRAHLHDSLDRVRGVANDIYPSVLDVRGLPDALRPMGVATESVGRYPAVIEAAVYFCCRALLAEPRTVASLRDDGRVLRLEIEGADTNDDACDLAEAVGGSVAAEPGRVTFTFPRDTESLP